VDPAHIREFARRRWDLLEVEKRRARAERFRDGGAVGAIEAANALREHFYALRPEGPTDASRRRDLAHHVALADKLRRVADGLAK
jgi:hypothetical protein